MWFLPFKYIHILHCPPMIQVLFIVIFLSFHSQYIFLEEWSIITTSCSLSSTVSLTQSRLVSTTIISWKPFLCMVTMLSKLMAPSLTYHLLLTSLNFLKLFSWFPGHYLLLTFLLPLYILLIHLFVCLFFLLAPTFIVRLFYLWLCSFPLSTHFHIVISSFLWI
jgi:hypothetical protein